MKVLIQMYVLCCIFLTRKLREQRESEHQAKLRLQKRLEALRPSASISGRQDPAETTPIIFDLVGIISFFFSYHFINEVL